MRVLVLSISDEAEKGSVRMTVQFGDEPIKEYSGEYDGRDDKYKFCNVGG